MQVIISEDIVREMESVKAKRDKYVHWLRYLYIFLFLFSIVILGTMLFIIPYKAYIQEHTDWTLLVYNLVFTLSFIISFNSFRGLSINKELKKLEKNGYSLKSSTYYSAVDDKFYFLASNTPASSVLYNNYREYEELYNSISALKRLEGKEFISVDSVRQTSYQLPVIVSNGLVTEHVILTASKIGVVYSKEVEELTFELKSGGVLTVTVSEKENNKI